MLTTFRPKTLLLLPAEYDDFQQELKAAGLSGRAFARLLKLNPNSITSYKAAGELPSHLAVIAALVRDMAETGLDFEATIARVPIEKKAARGSRVGLLPG